MDLRKLKKLIDLVQESGIGEIEITEGEEKVRISRQVAGPPVFMASMMQSVWPLDTDWPISTNEGAPGEGAR